MIEEKEIHLRDYYNVLRKRRGTVLTFFLVVFVLVAIMTFTATPRYEADTQVLIEKTDPDKNLQNSSYSTYDPDFLETQAQIIKSTAVAKKVVTMLNLDKNYEMFIKQHDEKGLVAEVTGWGSSLAGTVAHLFGAEATTASPIPAADGEDAAAAVQDELAEIISKDLEVSQTTDTRVVTIGFTSPNPDLAARITNSVTKAYIEQILDMRMESSGYSIDWMTKKADEERTKLEASEKALQDYMNSHNILTVQDKITILPEKLSKLNDQLTTAQADRKEQEALYQKVEEVVRNSGDPETIPVIGANEILQTLDQQILQAQQHIMELSKKYGPKHPLMKNANADLEMLTNKRSQEMNRIIKTIENDYELAKSKEENLQALLDKTKSDAVNLNERSIQYNILKRTVETNRNIYDALVAKIKEQSVTEQIQTVNVWVLEKAKVPEDPSKPNKPRNLLLGLVLGLFGGIGLAFFLEYLDNTVKVPEDVEAQFGVPVLGLVPLDANAPSNGDGAPVATGATPFAESFKTIRSAVQLSTLDQPPKTILITSSVPGDGKTTTAVNLALAMSQTKKKVLLLDADLRRPKIHKVFKLANDKGFSTVLAGASDMKIVQKSRFENLDVITSGPVPPNPTELLSSDRFLGLMRVLTGKYDHIIIDSPPLLSVTDPLLVSKVAKGVIVVARSARTTYDTIHRALKHLTNIQAQLLGVVINAADMKKGGYYSYQQYQYYYDSEE